MDPLIVKEIYSAIRFSISKQKTDIFTSIIDRIQCYFEKPAHDVFELKKNNTKSKGNIFEIFCKLYLINAYDYYSDVWLLSEVPDDVLTGLNLKRADVGIDIIAKDKYSNYYAVQCKYRKVVKNKKNVLSWKQLSTFYALTSRTNKFKKHVVMTNCDYVHREGVKKLDTDLSICFQTFNNTDNKIWLKILGDKGYKLNEIEEKKEEKKDDVKERNIKEVKEENIEKEKENIRNLRANFLAKLNSNK